MISKTQHRFVLSGIVLLLALIIGCTGALNLNGLTAQELFTLGKQKYDNKKYIQAIEVFQKIVYDYPGESIVDTAQYYLALSYFGNEDYAVAHVEFNRLANYYPSSVYVPSALFMSAVSQFESAPKNYGLDQSQVKDAVQRFEDFLIDFPESEVAPDAKAYLAKAKDRLARKDFEAGMTYYRMGANQAAGIYFQKVIDDYTGGDYAARSLYYTAEIDLKKHDFDEAQKRFDNFITVYPDHEWVEKARKKVVEAAFEGGKWAYEHGEPGKAKAEFQQFVNKYPNDKRVEKAKDYLDQIGDIPVDTQTETASEGS